METIKKQVSVVTSNPVGSIAGLVAGYLVAKKLVKTEKMWMLVAITAVGGFVGAMAQSKMKAKQSAPTAKTVGK